MYSIYFHLQIAAYERLASRELRAKKAREIFDQFLYADQLAMSKTVRLSIQFNM